MAAIALAASVTVATAPASAEAATTVKCPPHHYFADDGAFPGVSSLRATGLPRLTDGYAPRCLVAERLTGAIQGRFGRAGRYQVGGARWYAGTWTVRYRVVPTANGAYALYTATKGSQRITFKGTS